MLEHLLGLNPVTITGTDGRDRINGTGIAEIIDSGAGREFWQTGGVGPDAHIFSEQAVLRIADFEVGSDLIVLDNEEQFHELSWIINSKGQAAAVVGGRKLFLDDVDPAELTIDNFAIREADGMLRAIGEPVIEEPEPPVAEPPVEPPSADYDVKLMFSLGQSRKSAAPAENNNVVYTPDGIDGAWMLDWVNDHFSGRGWGNNALRPEDFQGLTAMHEVTTETSASSFVLRMQSEAAKAGVELPDIIHANFAIGGTTIEELRNGNSFSNMEATFAILADEIEARGWTVDPEVIIDFGQGRSNQSTDAESYEAQSTEYLGATGDSFSAAFGFDADLKVVLNQVSTFSAMGPTMAQGNMIRAEDGMIIDGGRMAWLENLDGRTHWDAIDYGAAGQIAGYNAFHELYGDGVNPLRVESVDYDAENLTLDVNFANVTTSLVIDNDLAFNEDVGRFAPGDDLGMTLLRGGEGTSGRFFDAADLSGGHLLDHDTIRFNVSRALDGTEILAVGRHRDNTVDADLDGVFTSKGWLSPVRQAELIEFDTFQDGTAYDETHFAQWALQEEVSIF